MTAFFLLTQHKNVLNDLMTALQLPCFKDIEIEFLEEYILVFQPIAVALDRLQGDKSCFYGTLLPTLLVIEKKFKRLNTSLLKHVHPLLTALASGFENRFREFLSLHSSAYTAVLASICNPNHKIKWLAINPEYNTEENRKKYQEMLIMAVRNDVQANTSKEPNEVIDLAEGSSSDDFFEYESLSSTSPASLNKDELEIEVLKYLTDNDRSLQSLNRYPCVKKVFLHYNTPLPSSAPAERLFSFAGHIHSPKRSKLSDNMFETLVIPKSNSSYL
ncbi:UNVERIFIED_CONTAM: hypothetical protein RMT77_014148 [Armadillidium vulgare]